METNESTGGAEGAAEKKGDPEVEARQADLFAPAPLGARVVIRLPDLDGRERLRPADVVAHDEQGRPEVRVLFAAADRDVSGDHGWATVTAAEPGLGVRQFRSAFGHD